MQFAQNVSLAFCIATRINLRAIDATASQKSIVKENKGKIKNFV